MRINVRSANAIARTRSCWGRPVDLRVMTASCVFLLLCVTCDAGLMACPDCKNSLTSGPAGAELARGFELSIYLMLAMPILILGSLGTLFYVQIRRARRNPDLWLNAIPGHAPAGD